MDNKKINELKSDMVRLSEFNDDDKIYVRDYWIQTLKLEKTFFL